MSIYVGLTVVYYSDTYWSIPVLRGERMSNTEHCTNCVTGRFESLAKLVIIHLNEISGMSLQSPVCTWPAYLADCDNFHRIPAARNIRASCTGTPKQVCFNCSPSLIPNGSGSIRITMNHSVGPVHAIPKTNNISRSNCSLLIFTIYLRTTQILQAMGGE